MVAQGDEANATSEDTTIYSDEEMALILREAADLADAPATGIGSSEGLSLEQIKAIAAEVGIDPAHVERAARLIPRGPKSALERVIGGPISHTRSVHFRTRLTEERASRLLSSVRAMADQPGEGHADAFGMSWRSWRGSNRISVTAHSEGGGTSVRVRVNRAGSLFMTGFLAQLGIVMPTWMLIETVNSIGELAALAAIPVGVLALARAFWVSSTRSIRDQAGALVDTVAQSLTRSEPGSGGTR